MPKSAVALARTFSVPVANVAYDETECAAFLLLRPRTLTVWRCRGSQPDLKFRKIGGKIIYLGQDILKYLNAEKHPKSTPYSQKKKSARRAVRA